MDGLATIRTLLARGPLPPTIMITGAGDEEIAIEALKLGASDYVVKDVEGGYLELLPSSSRRTWSGTGSGRSWKATTNVLRRWWKSAPPSCRSHTSECPS
jgi:DNA-binding NtrC family response regulator